MSTSEPAPAAAMLLARDFLPEDEERFAGLRVVAIWTAPWNAARWADAEATCWFSGKFAV
jgi:hypothetical protein